MSFAFLSDIQQPGGTPWTGQTGPTVAPPPQAPQGYATQAAHPSAMAYGATQNPSPPRAESAWFAPLPTMDAASSGQPMMSGGNGPMPPQISAGAPMQQASPPPPPGHVTVSAQVAKFIQNLQQENQLLKQKLQGPNATPTTTGTGTDTNTDTWLKVLCGGLVVGYVLLCFALCQLMKRRTGLFRTGA